MKNSSSRRKFLKLVPVVGASAILPAAAQTPATPPAATPPATPPATGAPQGRGQQGPIRVKKESMHAAEELMGIELTSAQEDMALRGVDGNLNSYEGLRKIDIPLDTDPAVWF